MEAFLRRQKPQTPDFLQENQGFAFYQFGGEGEIRTFITSGVYKVRFST